MKNAHPLADFFLWTQNGANVRRARRHWLRPVSFWRLLSIVGGLLFLLCAEMYSAWAAAIPEPKLPVQQSGTGIVFYAETQMSEPLWTALSQSLRADLADGAGEQPNGYVLDKEPILVRGSENLRGMLFSKVISVKLLGECAVFPQTERPAMSGPLGWVLMISGEVQPYVFIDCSRLTQVLRPKLAGMTVTDRRHAIAQAITQVLIHEWIHIATQSSSHGTRGVTKAYLAVDELIATSKSNYLLRNASVVRPTD